MKKILLVLFVLYTALSFSTLCHATVFVSENWDSGTPPASWPQCGSGTSFNGWEARSWDCDVNMQNGVSGGVGAGRSSAIYHTPPYSYKNIRHAGLSYDAGELGINLPNAPKIYVRFYAYFPSSSWNAFDPSPSSVDEEMVHFLFTNTALSNTGFRINLADKAGGADPWPGYYYTDRKNLFMNCQIGGSGCPNATVPGDHWNIHDHLDEWHAFEWMWDIPNSKYSFWIDGNAKVTNATVDVGAGYPNFHWLLFSIFDSYARSYTTEFYIDDIQISDTYNGLVGGGGGGSTYTIGGSISGLSGTVVLQDNGGDNLSRSAAGAFTFSSSVADGGTYNVTVLTQPSGQTCTVSNGSGTVSGANVTNVSVSCVSNPQSYTIGGSISGLSGTVVLQDNGGDNLSRSVNGTFAFSTPVTGGGGYSVTVLTQPSGQTCTVSNGSGTVSGANVTNVSVSCVNNVTSHTVGGSISGLSGTVVLQDNEGDDLSRSANGTFVFSTPVPIGGVYSVTVLTQPSGQTCTVSNGSGTVSGANVTNVSVSCVNTYTVGGSLSGFSGAGTVTLQNNGGDDLHLAGNGAFTFSEELVNGSAYLVSVSGQPSGQTCAVSNGSGNISGANVTNVGISCVNNPGPPAKVPSTVTGVGVK